MSEVIRIGLKQMGVEGLTRLKEHIEAGKPLLLDGNVYDEVYGLM